MVSVLFMLRSPMSPRARASEGVLASSTGCRNALRALRLLSELAPVLFSDCLYVYVCLSHLLRPSVIRTVGMWQVVEAFEGPFLRVEGYEKPLLNMANFDFLGMGQRKELKQAAVQALDKVGSQTGPRDGWVWLAGGGE